MSASGAAGAGPASSHGWAGPETRRVELDKICPVPLYEPGSRVVGKRGHSRTRQSWWQRGVDDVNSALGALNWFAGGQQPVHGSGSAMGASPLQLEVQARTVGLCESMRPAGVAIPPQQSAFTELLRGRAVYEDGAQAGLNEARFSAATDVSLPTCLEGSPLPGGGGATEVAPFFGECDGADEENDA